MWCLRSLSIQSSPALVTPADSPCVFQESKRFDTTKTSIPSTPFNSRASLSCSRQILNLRKVPSSAQNYSRVGDGLGETAWSVEGAAAWFGGDTPTLLLCPSSILCCLSARALLHSLLSLSSDLAKDLQ